ncbi:hypothetical protein F4677DRAFT_421595 [Hypoxylon crocopeplum]|nr:hypothetical protein F4677DRAFT_421595 [Hypoxylon crocopeplum]
MILSHGELREDFFLSLLSLVLLLPFAAIAGSTKAVSSSSRSHSVYSLSVYHLSMRLLAILYDLRGTGKDAYTANRLQFNNLRYSDDHPT